MNGPVCFCGGEIGGVECSSCGAPTAEHLRQLGLAFEGVKFLWMLAREPKAPNAAYSARARKTVEVLRTLNPQYYYQLHGVVFVVLPGAWHQRGWSQMVDRLEFLALRGDPARVSAPPPDRLL